MWLFMNSSIRRTSGCAMIGHGTRGVAADLAALHALLGVGQRLLVGGVADADALHADRDPGGVHHREHGAHAAVLLADQVADGTALVAVAHDAGGRGVDAHLVLDRHAADVVALARACRRRSPGTWAR